MTFGARCDKQWSIVVRGPMTKGWIGGLVFFVMDRIDDDAAIELDPQVPRKNFHFVEKSDARVSLLIESLFPTERLVKIAN